MEIAWGNPCKVALKHANISICSKVLSYGGSISIYATEVLLLPQTQLLWAQPCGLHVSSLFTKLLTQCTPLPRMLVFVLDLADMTARLEMATLAAMFLQLPNVDF